MAKNLTFNVSDKLTLTLQDLLANVTVRTGPSGKATVDLVGDDKLLDEINVTQPSTSELLIKGPEDAGGNITMISGGGRSVVSMGNVRGGSVVISGIVGGRIIFGDNLVRVNGKVISGGDKVTVIEGGELPTITVTVPQGTDLEIYDVSSVDSRGLGGKLDASLSAQSEVTVDSAKGLKIRCSGQTSCRVTDASGDLRTQCSGQSNITVVGNLGDVEAGASGQSSVNVNGNCKDCSIEASGQSSVNVNGHASGRVRKHASGMSHVYIS